MDQQAETAYATFVAASWRPLVRAAVFLGASPSDAEDIAQNTLVRAYAGWDKVEGATNQDAYVYRMLLNCLRDQRRTGWWKHRAATPLETVDPGPSPLGSDLGDRAATADAVHRALEALPRGHREVVVLRYFVQLTEAQTAATLGISPGTVKSRLSRSLARLAASDHLLDLTGDAR